MFMRDLRDVEKRSLRELQMMRQILGDFLPRQLQIRPNAKAPAYEELVIPERLREFAADLSGVGALLKPTREMANYNIPELARDQSNVPAYTPLHRSRCLGFSLACPFKGTPGGCYSLAHE